MYLEKLTKEQEARFPHFVDKWCKIGTDCNPADRENAEKHLVEAYKVANEKPPQKIFWADSPIAGHQLHCKLRKESNWIDPFYGQHEAGWLSFYDVFDEFGIDVSRIHPLTNLAQCCGWVWMFENIAICTERPTHILTDEEGRPHSTEKPAILYPDGWSLYLVHGVNVPKKTIMEKEKTTINDINNESNTDLQRIMLDIFGKGRYIEQSKAKVVAEDSYGKLYKQTVPGESEKLCVVRVVDTIKKDAVHWLRVPEHIKTAHEGVAWTFEETTITYSPLIET